MKTKSFTLIELLVVIVIIGILAGVIIVSTSSSINKANFAKAQAFSNTVQQELLLNLVSEWTFDEGNAEDSWGNNDGTLYGANGLPQLQTKENCVYGTCYLFDGVDDYIDCGNHKSLSMGTGDQTISMWVKFDNNPTSIRQTLIANGAGDDALGRPGIWISKLTSSSNIQLFFSDGIVITRASGVIANISDTSWHHLITVFDRDLGAIGFLDGAKALSIDITGRSGYIQNQMSTKIGSYYPSSYVFDGSIDDVRIYNVALSSSQIKQEYIAGLNSLLANNNISKEEYDQRLNSLSFK